LSAHPGTSGRPASKSERGDIAAGTKSESRDNLIRLALAVSGVALLVNEVVVAYVTDEGVSAAALIAAGAATLFMAYVGPHVTKVKYKGKWNSSLISFVRQMFKAYAQNGRWRSTEYNKRGIWPSRRSRHFAVWRSRMRPSDRGSQQASLEQ
jgi:hypothetical protein